MVSFIRTYIFFLFNLSISIFIFFSPAIAQSDKCFTDFYKNKLLKEKPFLEEKKNIGNKKVYDLLMDSPAILKTGSSSESPSTVLIVPVVVHIIHNGGMENIPDSMVVMGIQHLNDAFANTGAYYFSTGVNTGIQFCLAQQNENADSSTGIIRTVSLLTDMDIVSDDASLKALSFWDSKKHLNIWLVNSVSSSGSTWPGGYATYPFSHGATNDGIVCEANMIGSSTDNSKLLIHEAAHYLGLFHTFNEGCYNNNCLVDGDGVCDTPPDASTAGISCNSSINTCSTDDDDLSLNNPFRPVGSGGMGDQNDLTSNYLDYGFYSCQKLFTQGQKDRMVMFLTNIRESLLQSNGCLPGCTSPVVADFTVSDILSYIDSTITLSNTSTGGTEYEWSVNGNVFSTAEDTSFQFSTNGVYIFSLVVSNNDSVCTKNYSETIVVNCNSPVSASFTSSNNSVAIGDSVFLVNTSSGAANYQWFLDGNFTSDSVNAQFTFNSLGGFNIHLVANSGNCYDTSSSVYILAGSCSHKEGNIWYFGEYAGLDFNSGSPVALTDGAMTTQEGCASLSDSTGSLLFYTDGGGVWNKNHLLMPNGNGLFGSYSSTQSAVIVPQPGNDSIYIIFTVDAWGYAGGVNYSVVNMNLQGGLGDVTIKNIQLITPAAEKITAVKHCNNADIWVIVHEGFTDSFFAYLVTSSGVNLPVISNVGSVNGSTFEMPGCLKSSPDGSKLASAIYWPGRFELFDFDNSTGIISNVITLQPEPNAAYGVEFSPDGTKLYTGYSGQPVGIYQYNLLAGTPADIINSVVLIGASQGYPGTLQLGPDGKIYVALSGAQYLGVINNPNALGLACNYVDSGIFLGGKICTNGLPAMIQSFFYNPKPVIAGPGNICLFSTDTFYIESKDLCMLDTIFWTLGDASLISSVNDTAITLSFGDTGSYTLIAEIKTLCSMVRDSFIILVHSPPEINLGNDTAICSGVSVSFIADSGYADYLWQDSSSNPVFTTNSIGDYWVKVTDSIGCIDTDSVKIIAVNPAPPEINLGNDTAICPGNVFLLDAGTGFTTYEWQDGNTNHIYSSYFEGTYSVTVTNPCNLQASDSIIISDFKIDIFSTGDTTICLDTSFILDAGAGYISYFWQDNSENQTFLVNSFGTFYVIATSSDGCYQTDTIFVSTIPVQVINLGSDTFLCKEYEILLDAGSGFISYRWQDNSTSSYYSVTQPGIYSVTAIDFCQNSVSDTIIVEDDLQKCAADTLVFIPNIFTPDGDGINDFFYIKDSQKRDLELFIFNRWGELLFYSNNPVEQNWSGRTFTGEIVNAGVYFYLLKNISDNVTLKGYVQLVR